MSNYTQQASITRVAHAQVLETYEFWKCRLEGNKRRDRLVTRTLRKQGWRVLRIWEHELARKNHNRLLTRIRRALEAAVQRPIS